MGRKTGTTHGDKKVEPSKEIKRGETLAGQDKKHDYALKAGKEKRVKTVNMDNGITLKQSWTKETN